MSSSSEEEFEELTDKQLKKRVETLVTKVNLEETGMKQFLKLLSKEVGYDVKPKRDFVKQCLMEAMAEKEEEEEQQVDDDDEEEDEEDEDEAPPPRRKKGGGGGGLSAVKPISKELAAFLGQGDTMARTAVVKALWEYIRDHDLQNPHNRKEIILDDAMRKVFGCEMFTMFSMNKYVSAHIHPFKKVDLSSPSNKESKPRAARKRKSTGGSSNSAEKKKRKSGTQPPYRLSQDLQAVVGVEILPRPQVVSKIWEYIKAKGLQNPNDKREILCDGALQRVMGGKKKVTMFSMNRYIGDHLQEKLDKSQYQAEDSQESDDDD